jgi:hypothetical protein
MCQAVQWLYYYNCVKCEKAQIIWIHLYTTKSLKQTATVVVLAILSLILNRLLRQIPVVVQINASLPNNPYRGRQWALYTCLMTRIRVTDNVSSIEYFFHSYPIDCKGIMYGRAPGDQGFPVVSVFSPSIPPNAHNNPDLCDTTQCNYAFVSQTKELQQASHMFIAGTGVECWSIINSDLWNEY